MRYRIRATKTYMGRLLGRVGKNWIVEFLPDKILLTNGMNYQLPPLRVSTGVHPENLVKMFCDDPDGSFERIPEDVDNEIKDYPLPTSPEMSKETAHINALREHIKQLVASGLTKVAITEQLGKTSTYTYQEVGTTFASLLSDGEISSVGYGKSLKYSVVDEVTAND